MCVALQSERSSTVLMAVVIGTSLPTQDIITIRKCTVSHKVSLLTKFILRLLVYIYVKTVKINQMYSTNTNYYVLIHILLIKTTHPKMTVKMYK